jgi:F0F1-type ATP synthase epsilon subunit
MLSVTLLTASEVVFEGDATKMILPGEKGIFEVGFFHKPFVSRLLPGIAIIDQKEIPIRHGVVKVKNNRVIAMVELDSNTRNEASKH